MNYANHLIQYKKRILISKMRFQRRYLFVCSAIMCLQQISCFPYAPKSITILHKVLDSAGGLMNKRFFSLISFVLIVVFAPTFSFCASHGFSKWWEPKELEVFRKAYPDVEFTSSYDKSEKDWLITVSVKDEKLPVAREAQLYWCESRFLPKEKRNEKEQYRPMLYKLATEIPNPDDFTEKQIERIKNVTSTENRANGPIDPPFLFDIIYDVADRVSTESHIKKVVFFGGWSVNVHEKIEKPLLRASERIMALERTAEIDEFFKSLNRTDGFSWRTVRDTQSRSFHSRGLAIDILPRGYYQKIIYWGWQKQLDPEGWWKTPISKRWMPPKEVIDIFCEEGFVWGGRWIVWDNMHFEYHPELVIYSAEK